MLINNHFDAANLLGHPAFDYLALALGAYDTARRDNGLNPASHLWPDCLVLAGQLEMLRKTELKWCFQAVILFQAMMEKVPYFVPEIESGMEPTTKQNFASSWKDLLSQIKDPTTQSAAQAAFDAYNTDFYIELRNPIIHGRTPEDINKLNNIRAPAVHEGMRLGWRAYDYLLTEVFKPEQKHEPSWKNMCDAYNIPASLDLANFPDLNELSGEFSKKHMDGFRSAE